MLEHAIAIAVNAHAGQQDKAGEPYILHVLRVVLQVEGPQLTHGRRSSQRY